ncbi:uncharacterized protein LOC118744104 [Rhagoletis pomonella]|uniref:uncharacterized protein LOC118744104 n=1 Tax=Rhagoletis pomonella TaxID=28610 RepID=UPI00177E3A98|nr:uncharacterized protein LOC118744104 [Rhagoletis pomonella]
MQAHHAMPDFRCRITCMHRECQRHAHLGIVDQQEQCKCLGEVNASSIFLENVLDMANTLAQIMIICGIHECKAKSTVDVATCAFLHYDQVCCCIDTTPKKRLRKEDLFHELGKRCLMNRVEAHLAYTIIKRGFKAFYYKPIDDGRATFSEECVYVHAARKTAESYARYDGLSCVEQRGFEAKIKVAYKNFYDRMVKRRTQPEGENCNCCFCAKKRGHLIYGKKPPCETPKVAHRCPYCCQEKRRKLMHPGRAGMKCPKCHRAMTYCVCPKYEFGLDWVKSIWARPDMELYYKETIEERSMAKSGCETEMPEPEGKEKAEEEAEGEEAEGEEGNEYLSPDDQPADADIDMPVDEEEEGE